MYKGWIQIGTNLRQNMITWLDVAFVTLSFLSWSTDFEKNEV